MRNNAFSKALIKKILLAGLIAGTLDIIAAFIDAWFSFHSTPDKVLNGIADGAIGKQYADGSFLRMIFGLFIHFFIVYSYTFFFYLVYPIAKKSIGSNIVIGILYGLFIWATMRFIVLPTLSQVQFAPFRITKAFKPMLILIGAIGIPLAFMMNKIIQLSQQRRKDIIEIENPMH